MTRPSQFMRIELSPEQTHRLLEWAGEHLNAEIDADCEPSGYVLEISIGAGLPPSAEANYGGSRIDLDDVKLTLVDATER